MPIDNYRATIHLPDGFDYRQQELNLYSGRQGAKSAAPVSFNWLDERTLQLTADRPLAAGEGVTVSLMLPAANFTPDPLGIQSRYFLFTSPWELLWLLLPAAGFWLLYKVWRRWGDDPAHNPTVAPEFGPPEQLDPIAMGLVYTNCSLASTAVAAGVIDLAVRGHLTIKEEASRMLGVKTGRDYTLTKTTPKGNKPVPPALAALEAKLFASRDAVKLSALKNNFYQETDDIGKTERQRLVERGWLERTGHNIGLWLTICLGTVLGLAGSLFFTILSGPALWAFWLLSLIILVFAAIMPRRPAAGWALLQQIRGFRLYLQTAERYRQRFLEDAGLWERLLPYTILFGLTKKWAKILRDLTAAGAAGTAGKSSYAPVWWAGGGPFDAAAFSQSITGVASSVASSLTSSPSSSGSGGGGFSGSGGGGGGDGGW